MKLSIRNIVIASAMMAAAAVTVTSASAETRLKVPFNFTVGSKICPAGTYTVDKDVVSRIVTLTNKNTSQTFRWTVTTGDAAPTESKVSLRFNEVGENHSLKSVQYGSMVSNVGSKSHHNSDAQTRVIQGE